MIGFDDHSAQSVCTFGYCEGPGKEILLFQGRTDGMIVEARGQTSFGMFGVFPRVLDTDEVDRMGCMLRV